MDIITQTNRTILFAEINPEMDDLLTLIGDTRGINSLNDDKMKEISQKLTATNLESFFELCRPVIYSFFNSSNQRVMYNLKKPENIPDNCITPIPITMDENFLKMLMTLIQTKGAQGAANVDFQFQSILEMISPGKVMDDIKQVRKEIQYVYGQYEELDEEDPKRLDMGDKLNYMFEQASQNYNNVMAMLPLAIEDIKTRLLLGTTESEGNGEVFKAGVLSLGNDGELKILEVSKSDETQLAVLDDKANAGLIEAFKEDYEALNDDQSDYVRDLVVRTFCPLTSTMESTLEVEKEVANYNHLLDFYKESKNNFLKVAKPLIQTILGVKIFFDQYEVKEKGMKPALLITNNKLDMMVKASNLPRLVTYFNTANDKNSFDNTIWFGIVPDIALDNTSGMKLNRLRFDGNAKAQKQDLNTMESLSVLLNTLHPYRVSIFFSFETGEDTTFNYVATEGIEKFKDKCKILTRQDYSEFAIPCIPNLTIIPKDKSGLVLDKKMFMGEDGGAILSQEKEDLLKLYLDGVYVGGAFLAAGMVSAWQCPNYLKERFPNTSMDYPGVRFDIEESSNALLATSTMAQEITGFTNAIKNSINQTNFGFIFSSENAQVGGKEIKKIMVYKARNLLVAENQYEPIFKTLVTTYIERMLRFYSNDFKQDNILKFFSNNPNSQKSRWTAAKGYVNSLIHDGDDLDFTIDERLGMCNIEVTFNNNVKNLKVEMTRKK
jgi:hypothetical protein